MNAFPGMGNIDPSKMDAAQMKQMLNLFSGMSDDQIKNTMKMMGIDMDPSVIRQFVDQLKNADDDTINKFKEQYSKGKVNMNSFSKYSKNEAQIKEAKKLIDNNKFNDAIELCNKEITELSALNHMYREENDLIRYDITYPLNGNRLSTQQSNEIFSIIKNQLQTVLDNLIIKKH